MSKREIWANRLISLSPRLKMSAVIGMDALICIAAFYGALLITVGPIRSLMLEDFFLSFAAAVSVITVLFIVGAYKAVIRFFDIILTFKLFQGYAVASCLLFVLATWFDVLGQTSAIAVFLILGPLLSTQLRIIAQRLLRPGLNNSSLVPIVIYGAGHAGMQLAAALSTSARYRVKAFVDDRLSLQGREILGLKVFSPSRLALLKQEGRCEQIFLAMPSITKSRRRQLLESLQELALRVQVVPGLDELASGHRRPDDVRDVQIEDLLGRDQVAAVPGLAGGQLANKCVLVTGAGGSIGSEICRQVAVLGISKLVLFEVSEYALYKIHQELETVAQFRDFELVAVLGSVVDKTAIERAISKNKVNVFYHAAAYKHVPLVEANVLSAVQNNVFGTLNACRAAIKCGVQNFILVSTDKAVRPTSIMGASKRVCELIVQAFASENPAMCMSMVRFGNVLASSGSVVPLFREQILRGGPVTVTHVEVTRYFMTIPEAAQLVLQAGAMGHHGEVFVLDMGKPVKIFDLAERMIHLSGLEVRDDNNPRGDIEVKVVGLRPGEKLYEELLIGNNPSETKHPRIFLARESCIGKPALLDLMARLEKAIYEDSVDTVRQLLAEVVEGFSPQQKAPAFIASAPVTASNAPPVRRAKS